MADENEAAFLSQVAPDARDAPDPQMWLWSAERLLYGGQSLWDIAAESWPPKADQRRHPAAPGQFGTAFLLFGYAFENAIKGLIAQRLVAERKPARDEKGKQIGIPSAGHKLSELATSDVGLDLDPDEESLLERLAEYVYWAGRYPMMKDAGGFRAGQLVPKTAMHPDTDRPLVDALFEKIVANYDAKYHRLSSIEKPPPRTSK